MRLNSPLNERQWDVLRRVAEGPPVTSKDSGLATTVYALRNRQLVTTRRIPRRGWIAELTERGRYLVDHGHFPPPDERIHDADEPPEASPWPEPTITVDELFTRLEGAGGRMTVRAPSDDERAAWRHVVDAARPDARLPLGWALKLQGRDRGSLYVELVESVSSDRLKQWERQRLPDVVTVALHGAVAGAALPVSDACLDRARRILSVLVAALEGEGFRAEWSGQLLVVRGKFSQAVSVGEEDDLVDVFPDEDALESMYDWQRVAPVRKQAPSGRLKLELPDERGRYRGRQRRWADRQRWRLDDKLGEIIDAILDRAADHEAQEREAEAEAIDRQRRWEQAMETARVHYVEDVRRSALRDEVARWREANEVRRYCDALAEVATSADDDWAAKLRKWITWARGYADDVDPLRGDPALPDPPEPGPEDLRPYLDGWSPYGPDWRL